MNAQRLMQLVNTAILLLQQLEAALDAGDQRQVGARLYELSQQLNVIRSEIQDGKR